MNILFDLSKDDYVLFKQKVQESVSNAVFSIFEREGYNSATYNDSQISLLTSLKLYITELYKNDTTKMKTQMSTETLNHLKYYFNINRPLTGLEESQFLRGLVYRRAGIAMYSEYEKAGFTFAPATGQSVEYFQYSNPPNGVPATAGTADAPATLYTPLAFSKIAFNDLLKNQIGLAVVDEIAKIMKSDKYFTAQNIDTSSIEAEKSFKKILSTNVKVAAMVNQIYQKITLSSMFKKYTSIPADLFSKTTVTNDGTYLEKLDSTLKITGTNYNKDFASLPTSNISAKYEESDINEVKNMILNAVENSNLDFFNNSLNNERDKSLIFNYSFVIFLFILVAFLVIQYIRLGQLTESTIAATGILLLGSFVAFTYQLAQYVKANIDNNQFFALPEFKPIAYVLLTFVLILGAIFVYYFFSVTSEFANRGNFDVSGIFQFLVIFIINGFLIGAAAYASYILISTAQTISEKSYDNKPADTSMFLMHIPVILMSFFGLFIVFYKFRSEMNLLKLKSYSLVFIVFALGLLFTLSSSALYYRKLENKDMENKYLFSFEKFSNLTAGILFALMSFITIWRKFKDYRLLVFTGQELSKMEIVGFISIAVLFLTYSGLTMGVFGAQEAGEKSETIKGLRLGNIITISVLIVALFIYNMFNFADATYRDYAMMLLIFVPLLAYNGVMFGK